MMSDDSGSYRRWLKAVSLSLLIAGVVASSACASEDTPLDATVPDGPAVESASTTIEAAIPTTSPAATTTTTVEDLNSGAPSTETPTPSTPPTTTVLDLSTDDPATESSPDELVTEVEPVPEVERDVAPPGALYETSAQAEEWLIGPFAQYWNGEYWRDPPAASWLFPWGDGFLQIGFLNTSEQIPSETNLFAQISDDGLNWEPPFQLSLPREHLEFFGADPGSLWFSSWPVIRSNGEGLVVLSQLPDRHLGNEGADLALFRRSAPASAHVEQSMFVSVTDDLESWNHYEYPLSPPDGVHESLANHIVVEDVIVSDEGWMIQISTLSYMDIGLLVPDNIREASKEIRWFGWQDETWVSTSDGLLVEWEIEDSNSGSTESHRKVFSWEELGFSEDLFNHYGFVYMRPNHYGHRYKGSVLVGKWGEGPIRAELPWAPGVCCEIIATDAGYIGLSVGVEPGYASNRGWGALVFSHDGLTWQRIDPPADEVFKEPENYDNYRVWVSSIHAVGDRVVMHGLESGPYYICGDGDRSRFQFEYIWVGDATGSMWESQKIYDNPCHARYRIAKSAGRGIFLYINVQFDNSEESYTWEGRYHSTIVSADGVNWFTFYEEPDPNRSSVAFNGNVAVRVDNAGNSYRYELQ